MPDAHSAECDVPECEGGYVRLPVVYEEVLYGHTEKFVRFEYVTCGECKGFGRVQTRPIPPGSTDVPQDE